MRLAIVEDEKNFADNILGYLQRFQKETGYQIETVWFQDGCDIVEEYKSDFDVILMDIQMKFMDGMTAARKIREKDSQVVILFLTNMVSYAIRGYEVDAMDYIIKPVTYFSFSEKLKKALKTVEYRKSQYIVVPIEGGIQKVDLSSVYYVECRGHNLFYKQSKAEVESRGTMNKWEALLAPYGFYRNSKSFLVNLEYVDGIQKNECMIHGERIPVSRLKKKEFMQALLKYVSEEYDDRGHENVIMM